MSTRTKPARSPEALNRAGHAGASPAESRRRRRRRLFIRGGAIGAVALAGLFLISRGEGPSNNAAGTSGGAGTRRGAASGGPAGSGLTFAVGDPGPGEAAPAFSLPSTAGGEFDLGAQRGKTVLLYFHEGLGCQPCWDQMRDIEQEWTEFEALGIDQFVAIAGNPLPQLRQKAVDDGLVTPVLADPKLSLGEKYKANQYGMMGTSTYGHSFIVVGPDGMIRWRGDYGGEPEYTMYLTPADLLADLRAGLDEATSAS